jgi:NAD(P)H-hydrate epimerase
VLDADALNVLAGEPSAIAAAAGPVVITPHPGEASRLLGISTADIEADRLAAARSLAAKTRAVVVLKGARTIVCDGASDHQCSINPTGGPSLATGGSGDVLAGTIGALLAQGLSAVNAARAGVYVHGAAGDALGEIHGDRGVVSSDLPDAIAGAIRALSVSSGSRR